MKLEDLNAKYDKLQERFGAKELNSIYNGGCSSNPDICFVFMNPTGRNIASKKSWKGIRSPWIGTKNIWDLFYSLDLLDKNIYKKIKSIKGSEWSEEFALEVYKDVEQHKYFITNLGKCTQVDARELPNSVYMEYLELLKKEIQIINPKVIILFVSQCRKKKFIRKVNNKEYDFYSVYYPVGNGRFNIDKSIEDIKYIIDSIKDKSEL